MKRATFSTLAGALALTVASAAVPAESPFATRAAWTSYRSAADGLEIPALSLRPAGGGGDVPLVLFVHGRWGLAPEVVAQLERLAERGVEVFAPDYYFARAVPALPWFNDPDLGLDVQSAIPHLRKQTQRRIALVAQDHGGFYAIQAAARFPEAVGALVGIYPLTNDPQQPKPRHLYAYAADVDKVKVPTLFLIGGEDREMRRIAAKRVVERLQSLKQDATYVEYPGATRCYDWKIDPGRIADAMARADSLNQVVRFLKQTNGGSRLLVLEPSGWRTI